jgi:hypothetical protein
MCPGYGPCYPLPCRGCLDAAAEVIAVLDSRGVVFARMSRG